MVAMSHVLKYLSNVQCSMVVTSFEVDSFIVGVKAADYAFLFRNNQLDSSRE